MELLKDPEDIGDESIFKDKFDYLFFLIIKSTLFCIINHIVVKMAG